MVYVLSKSWTDFTGNYFSPLPQLQLQLHKWLFMPCVAFHVVRSTSSLVLAMSSSHLCCLGTRTLDTDHSSYLQVLTYNCVYLQLEHTWCCFWPLSGFHCQVRKQSCTESYPDENLHARHMKQLLVFAGDAGDKFFVPSTLPCFDKVAVKDRIIDSDLKDSDNL